MISLGQALPFFPPPPVALAGRIAMLGDWLVEAGATETWRVRLSEEEAERVVAGTAEIASAFYDDTVTSS